MVKEILKRLEEEKSYLKNIPYAYQIDGVQRAINIVQEIIEEHNDGWIPIESGLLPNKTKEYLVTMINSDEKSTMYSVCHEIFYASTEEWDCDRDEDNDWKVIAWKPKELPYKPKEK